MKLLVNILFLLKPNNCPNASEKACFFIMYTEKHPFRATLTIMMMMKVIIITISNLGN